MTKLAAPPLASALRLVAVSCLMPGVTGGRDVSPPSAGLCATGTKNLMEDRAAEDLVVPSFTDTTPLSFATTAPGWWGPEEG